MNTAVVIPVGGGRMDNLRRVLACLAGQTIKPKGIVLVYDGTDESITDWPDDYPIPVKQVRIRKHEPGMEQPRNVGVRFAHMHFPECSHVWFLDSDVIVYADCLEQFILAGDDDATEEQLDRAILVGPYDWLPPGVTDPVDHLKNDPRWPSFDGPGGVKIGDLSAGLACFSGNLIWNIDEFKKTGGFWNELHHGRCEDGELGLRAVAMGVPILFVPDARGWHIEHDRNMEVIVARNARDVPMLNDRHPWVQGEGLFVVEEDGKRFNVRCACGWEGNTALIWEHQESCAEATWTT